MTWKSHFGREFGRSRKQTNLLRQDLLRRLSCYGQSTPQYASIKARIQKLDEIERRRLAAYRDQNRSRQYLRHAERRLQTIDQT